MTESDPPPRSGLTTKFEYHSAWADGLRKEGREKGREEGREEGELRQARRSVLRVLAARSIEVTPEQRRRIEACVDVDQLDSWLAAASTLESSTELFR